MKQNKIVQPYKFPKVFKRGEFTTIQGIRLQYVKMVKGRLAFKSFPDGKKYQLNMAGYLIPC